MKNVVFLLGILFGGSMFSQDLKLMTYNLRLDVASDGENRFDNRKDILVNQIKFYEPDILGTQEGLPHQIDYLGENLDEYNSFGQGRDGDENGESVSIFYKKDRLKLELSYTFWLSETPKEISKGWDAAFNRICTYGLFLDTKNNSKFWVFNTHFDHKGDLARQQSVNLILDEIKKLNIDNYPVFFMGDFNLEPKSPSLKPIFENFKDAKEFSSLPPFGPNGTFNGFNNDYPFERRIDYIFISHKENLEVLKYAVLDDIQDGRFPSDHFPVMAVISIKEKH